MMCRRSETIKSSSWLEREKQTTGFDELYSERRDRSFVVLEVVCEVTLFVVFPSSASSNASFKKQVENFERYIIASHKIQNLVPGTIHLPIFFFL